MGIVVMLITGMAAGASPGLAADHPVNQNAANLVLAATTAPSYITCPQGYVCTLPADAQDKQYVMANDTRPCGNFQGLPEYCYRAPLNVGLIAVSRDVHPVSPGKLETTSPKTPVPVKIGSLETIRPIPVGPVTLIPISHRVGLVPVNQTGVYPMTTNTGLSPSFLTHNGLFQSMSRMIFGNLCNGKSVDFQTDNANCGGCGWACPAGLTCQEGQCDVACSKGLENCEYTCIDLQTDSQNCGKCGSTCGAAQSCCTGKCTDFSTDNANCGMCGHACGPEEKCTAGSCTGLCGNACDKAETCNNGVCTATLPATFVEYDSAQYEDHTDYGPAATCPAADSQGCWIRLGSSRTKMGTVNYAGIYTGSVLVTYYDHAEVTLDTQNMPAGVKSGILAGTRKVYLVMHAASSATGTSNALNRDSSLWKIAYNTDASHYTMYITGIPGSDGTGGTETPPGQSAAVTGARARYNGQADTVTVDITDIVKAWLGGSVQNNGLKLMPYSEFWPEPEDADTSYGFTTAYDSLAIRAVSADAPL